MYPCHPRSLRARVVVEVFDEFFLEGGASRSPQPSLRGTGVGFRAKLRFQAGISPCFNFLYTRRWCVWQRTVPVEALRPGSGQRKKPLHDKILEGNPGKRPLTVMEFKDTADLQGQTMPPPREFLKSTQKNGKQSLAVEIYEGTWQWLHERRCAHLIPAQLLEQYAQSVSRWIQCEESITEFGFWQSTPLPEMPSPAPMWRCRNRL